MIIDDFMKFLDTISVEGVSEDYWYDVGVVEVQNMLEKFSKREWDLLERLIKDKSVEWQKKLIYSFDDVGNEQEIKIIMKSINTDNSELFEICIDTLRCLLNEKTRKLIWEKPGLLEKVRSMAIKTDSISSTIYMDFLEKVRNPLEAEEFQR